MPEILARVAEVIKDNFSNLSPQERELLQTTPEGGDSRMLRCGEWLQVGDRASDGYLLKMSSGGFEGIVRIRSVLDYQQA
jgi:hypothetical protein